MRDVPGRSSSSGARQPCLRAACRAAAPSWSRPCSAASYRATGKVLILDQRRLRHAHGENLPGDARRAKSSPRRPRRTCRQRSRRRSIGRSPADPGDHPRGGGTSAKPPRAFSIRSRRSPEITARHGRGVPDRRHERLRRRCHWMPARSPSTPLVASSNKCLEGTPGVGFCLARSDGPGEDRGKFATSLSLDLHDQWMCRWRTTASGASRRRFKPSSPSSRALQEFAAEGGVEGRGATLPAELPDPGGRHAAISASRPCCRTSFRRRSSSPSTCRPTRASSFETFYEGLRARGYVIYPGKLTVAESFRIGCIGHLGAARSTARWRGQDTALPSEMGV